MPPQDLSQRELILLNLYRNCQFGMTPQAFYARWNVTHVQIAQICGVSKVTVDRWFSQGQHHRQPTAQQCRKLAEMNLVWEQYERFPSWLKQYICLTRHQAQG